MTLLLDAVTLQEVLDVQASIGELRTACQEQADDLVTMPPRQTVDARDGRGWLRISMAFLNGSGFMGFKAMNRAPGIGMRYIVGLYEIGSGELVAMMDADAVTTQRTAATNALGTHLLAPAGETTVGILGSGVQARALLRAYAHLRRLDHVYVHSPRREAREDCAAWARRDLQVEATAVDDPAQLAESSPVTVVALRASSTPVYRTEWLRPGGHVTGLSSVRPEAREVEEAVWPACDVIVVDDRSSVEVSGDGHATGGADLSALPELWELVAGRVGRTSDGQRTMFKSSGNALQDIAVAIGAYRRARAMGLGQDLGPFPTTKPYA
ncbi:MAG: ornithine cyclodeaminase family protein [Actinomycetota bacterium]|jgi:ornithine cyclodeaminase/alanine dehydrogenase-like protein (mu-crystallin family)|nr:ornithine cyclodeaminase family protein [Actinomycetota bacterium]